jgi:hypothetical protein
MFCDMHGHSDILEVLLPNLGYIRNFALYLHPDKRQVAFVGDFIHSNFKI